MNEQNRANELVEALRSRVRNWLELASEELKRNSSLCRGIGEGLKICAESLERALKDFGDAGQRSILAELPDGSHLKECCTWVKDISDAPQCQCKCHAGEDIELEITDVDLAELFRE